MGWTKGEFVIAAYGEIGLASYVYDLDAEQLQPALNRLDAMLAAWNAKGIRVGYPISSSPSNSDMDTPTSVSDAATEAIYLNLALRLAPSVGKTVSLETKENARSAYLSLLHKVVGTPSARKMPGTMPAGAGNRRWRSNSNPFLDAPDSTIDAGTSGELEFS